MFNPSSGNPLSTLMAPTMTNISGQVSAAVTIITNIGNYCVAFLGALFLWSPTIWSGYFVWIWFLVCLPISIGMVFSVITILRGVHAS